MWIQFFWVTSHPFLPASAFKTTHWTLIRLCAPWNYSLTDIPKCLVWCCLLISWGLDKHFRMWARASGTYMDDMVYRHSCPKDEGDLTWRARGLLDSILRSVNTSANIGGRGLPKSKWSNSSKNLQSQRFPFPIEFCPGQSHGAFCSQGSFSRSLLSLVLS